MHDIHIHTELSACARAQSALSDYLAVIPDIGLRYAGFANHLWDRAIPGASSWYVPQDIDHVSRLKDELQKSFLPGVKLLFGCECEYVGNGKISLHRDNAGLFDYVLAAPCHFQMAIVRPASITGGRELGDLFVRRFLELCDIDFVDGIAHPFMPFGFAGKEKEALQCISPAGVEKCFTRAARNGKSVEINISVLVKLQKAGCLELYKEIMKIASGCGCKFHVGSDAHGLDRFTTAHFAFAEAFAGECGIEITDPDFIMQL